jgi:hypothetical protein
MKSFIYKVTLPEGKTIQGNLNVFTISVIAVNSTTAKEWVNQTFAGATMNYVGSTDHVHQIPNHA